MLMEFTSTQTARENVIQLQFLYNNLVKGVQVKCSCSISLWLRNEVNEIFTIFTSSMIQDLISKIQKGLSDHTEFFKAKNELENWLTTTEVTLQDCGGYGDEATCKNKLETVKIISTRLPEGQHFLSLLQDTFTRVISGTPFDQQETMRSDAQALRSRWEKLKLDLKSTDGNLKDACLKWEDFKEKCDKKSRWINSTQNVLSETPKKWADLGEMKMVLEQYKVLLYTMVLDFVSKLNGF